MQSGSFIRKILYWGGLLGSISAIIYAVFIWQFQWVYTVSGVAYLDDKPVVIQKPNDTQYTQFTNITTIITPNHSMVAVGQTLFMVQAQILPNMNALNTYYDKNQQILYTALLDDTNAIFTTPNSPYAQRIYDIFTIAYKQDVSKIQTKQYQIQEYIDDFQQQSHATDITPTQKRDLQSQIAQMLDMQQAVNGDMVAYLKQNAETIKQKLFKDIITKPIWQNIPIKSPINGILTYADTTTPENIARITPLNAPVAVKVYMPTDTPINKETPPALKMRYKANKNSPPVQVSAKIDAINPNDTDKNGHMAVIVKLQDPYIYAQKHFIPESVVYISIPYGTGTPYQYAKRFLKLRF